MASTWPDGSFGVALPGSIEAGKTPPRHQRVPCLPRPHGCTATTEREQQDLHSHSGPERRNSGTTKQTNRTKNGVRWWFVVAGAEPRRWMFPGHEPELDAALPHRRLREVGLGQPARRNGVRGFPSRWRWRLAQRRQSLGRGRGEVLFQSFKRRFWSNNSFMRRSGDGAHGVTRPTAVTDRLPAKGDPL
jgi:hypothetical protein